MKEVFVDRNLSVELKDSSVPKPGKDQVLIKVVYSGSNPKDWKYPIYRNLEHPLNTGDDIAGIVHEVGENVFEWKKGDRVAAFHEMGALHGSFAEYAVAWKHTTFRLPEKTSFSEGAALPLAALTAVVGLYDRLKLPQPWTPAVEGTKTPLLVYGGSSAVGSYALQFAVESNIHPLIVVAGKAAKHVAKFLDTSKGDTIVDYREGAQAVQDGIKKALNGQPLLHAFDVVSEGESISNVAAVLSTKGTATFVLPVEHAKFFSEDVTTVLTTVGDVHQKSKDLGYVYSQYMTRMLDEGSLVAQPQEEVPGGLAGVQEGLTNLKAGKASAVKYVFKIADTPGIA